jgi:hypothetical protein
MAILGSNEKPVMMRGKSRGKILGDTGSWYKPENKKKYEDNWDRIFNKPDTKTETKAQ